MIAHPGPFFGSGRRRRARRRGRSCGKKKSIEKNPQIGEKGFQFGISACLAVEAVPIRGGRGGHRPRVASVCLRHSRGRRGALLLCHRGGGGVPGGVSGVPGGGGERTRRHRRRGLQVRRQLLRGAAQEAAEHVGQALRIEYTVAITVRPNLHFVHDPNTLSSSSPKLPQPPELMDR